MRRALNSLTFRVVAFSTLWAVIAMVVVATVISTLYRQAAERNFDSLLSAHLFHLIGAVGISEEGRIDGDPNLGDLRFSEPGSGWYWAVDPVTEGLTGRLRSLSMTQEIATPSPDEIPYDFTFQRNYYIEGAGGELVEVLESEFVLDDKNRAARFRVMGNRTEIELEISDFNNSLYGYLALFGLGMIAINAAAILLGMRPLGRVSKALGAIRAGNAERLDGTFPAEIAPLAQETNELIENNRRIMERARTQVGNLAHSLKTPLAVILNEARSLQNRQGSLIEGQAGLMQGQIDHYLTRARAVAQRDGVVFRTQVHPTLERMVRAMGKLKPGLDIAFEPADVDPIFAGEREDLEEIVGNLLDNAMKWGRRQVRVATKAPDGESWFECTVEDDGPGIPADKAQRALTRGQRLDESVPGTGLGLAIVTELVKEYGGELFLEKSDLGGLRARFRLRRLAA